MNLSNLRSKIILSALIGLGVVIAIGLFSDIRAVGRDFSTFRWSLLPAILGLTVFNYWLRWLKWDYYLRHLNLGSGVSRGASGTIFMAGLVMSVTPGKLGEVLKSYLLRQMNGTPISRSAPIVLAERLTDGLAMLLLMALGLTLYPPARPVFAFLVVATLIGVVVVQYRPLCEAILRRLGEVPFGAKIAPKLETIYQSTYQLLDWRILTISTIISVISWGAECIALYLVLIGLGVEPGWLLLLQATFVFAASTLFGLVSFLPGGLGVSEASSVGLLVALSGLSTSAATTATIVIRFCTLWFGVLLGVVALARFSARIGGTPSPDDTQSALPADG
ncbi:MAG: flippase-like domain-containing protein [Oscillochloris sp.]|nr:flippase-like domain-containing protein [Oscillochloris sp.]